MKGTNAAVTLPIDLIPPIRTAPAATVTTRPTTQVGTPKELSSEAATVLDWVMLPMPKLARTANTANAILSVSPKPFGMAFAR